MNFQVKARVYATPDGRATHDAGSGANKLLLETGAVVSAQEAEALGLRRLGAELDKAAVEQAQRAASPVGALQELQGRRELVQDVGGMSYGSDDE